MNDHQSLFTFTVPADDTELSIVEQLRRRAADAAKATANYRKFSLPLEYLNQLVDTQFLDPVLSKTDIGHLVEIRDRLANRKAKNEELVSSLMGRTR